MLRKEESIKFLEDNYGKWEFPQDVYGEELDHFLNLCDLARSGEVGRFDIYNPKRIVYFYLLEQIENNPISYVVKFPLIGIGDKSEEDENSGTEDGEIFARSKEELEKSEKINDFFQKWCLKQEMKDSNRHERLKMFNFATCKRVFVVSVPIFLNEEFLDDAVRCGIDYFQISQILHLQICDFCGTKIDVSMIEKETTTCYCCNKTIIVRNQTEMATSR